MNTHIINKQVIELKVDSEENAFGLQQQVREAYLSDVLPLISEVLDEFAGPDEIIRIDRLELDFGILHPNKMEQEMKERVREAILKQFPKLKQKNEVWENRNFSVIETVTNGKRNKVQLMNESFSQRELLTIFLETGILPWWSPDEIEAPDIDAMLDDLLKKEPVTTLQWLHQLALKSPLAINRLVMQVSKTIYKNILAAFPEKIIATLEIVTKQLLQVQGNSNHFPWQDKQNHPLLFSALILPPEILQSSSENSSRKILETFIAQLSIVYHTPQIDIEQQLYANALAEIIVSHNKTNATPDVVDYLIEWEKQHPEIASSVSGSNYPALEVFSENDHLSISKLADTIERALKEFEERQTSRQVRRKKPVVKKENQSVLRQLNEHTEEINLQKIKSKKEEGSSIEKLTEEKSVSEKQLKNYSGLSKKEKTPDKNNTELSENENQSATTPHSENNSSDSVINISNEIITKYDQNEFVKINWFKTKDEKTIPEKTESNTKNNTENIPETKNNPVTNESEEKVAINLAEEKYRDEEIISIESENMETYFASDDHPMLQKKPSAGMTRFGGLILIAPFLPAFFTELKLIADGKFAGEAEQHKALHLLNFLGSGKTSSPEYALMLHKLLCGIEITKPVPKSIKLSKKEKDEALFFLNDIAEQWTALRSTSGKSLRDTFFHRNGILEKKDNIWLLRIERGPMDILLETLPWTISIIKAPWMQQLLQVEW